MCRVFETILEITAICSSKKISVNILGYLKCLVQEHLKLFKSCFDANITPKQHYLVHLPSQILSFGPPIRAWAMSFEVKHQQFKHIPWVTKHFKNLAKTVSERHQSGVCADNLALSGACDASYHPLFRGGGNLKLVQAPPTLGLLMVTNSRSLLIASKGSILPFTWKTHLMDYFRRIL